MEPVVIKFCGQLVSSEDMELIEELAEDFWGSDHTLCDRINLIMP